MKRTKLLFVMLIVASLGIFSCSKDTTEPEPEIPTFEETGVVDEGGGIVHITDEESKIFGTYIDIPEEALNNNVEISIQESEETNFLDSTSVVIDFQPSGTQFSELVEIGIPYKENSDIENLQLYTYNEDNEAWEVMLIDHIDTENRLVISKTTHFSLYTAGDYISIMFEADVYKTSSNRIGVHLQAPDFNEIPTRLAYWNDGFINIEQCIDGDPFDNFPKAWFKITILEDTWWLPDTYSFKATYYDRYFQQTMFGDWKAEINDSNSDLILQYNELLNLSELSDFYSGLPYIIESESFDTSEDFVIIVDFYYSQYTDLSASSTLLGRYTPIFSFAIENIEFDNLAYVPSYLDEDNDMITNDYDIPETNPVVEIVTPTDVQSGYITINYTITDDDGGVNEFGIYHQSNTTGVQQAELISSSTGNIHNGSFIENIEPGNHSLVWDSNVVFNNDNDNVKMMFSWVDPNGGMPGPTFESDYFEIDNTSTTNQPPNPPANPSPSNNATSVSTNTNLDWDCTDPDPNDILTFDLYFGISPNPPLFEQDLSQSSYDLDELDPEETYYWKIVAHDDHSNSTTGNIWQFTTESVNQPPNPPSNPNPANNAIDVSINTDLNWGCTDPDPNDILTFDLYFGISPNPPLFEQDLSQSSYDLDELDPEETYYWKIVAHDDHSNSTTGNIWQFTTESVNQPPNPPSNPNPANNAIDVSINTDLNWGCTDPDPNDILTFDLYFGISPNPPLFEQDLSQSSYDLDELDPEETYYWKIEAHDDHSNSTTGDIWQFTTYDGGGGGDFEWCDVPAGDYTYGDPPQTLNIDYDYEIMKYEVTNQQYVGYLQDALNAGNITVTSSTVEGYYEGDENYGAGTYEFLDLGDSDCRIDWDGSNFSIISGYEDHPVVEVTWFGSWAFAEHYNLRLPTEHEWEKAARGNTGYDYPWGNSIDGSRANYWDSGDPFEVNDVETTPVGMYNGQTIQGFSTTDSPSPYGAYDLAGNVWNWTDSWYDTSPSRVVRGGSWNNYTSNLQSWDRKYGNATDSNIIIGFRCVRP